MSDFKHSTVTYTSVSSPVEDYSDIRSPEVDGPLTPNYLLGPEEPEQAPVSPDYVPGPEELEQEPLSLDYVPGPVEPDQAPPSPVYLPYVPMPVYPKYMPPEDDVFPAEEQPLRVAATPTVDSPGYIPEFDPNGDPKDDEEEDPEEDLVDYPADSTVVALPSVDHVPSEEVTEPLPQIPSPPLPIPSPPPDSPTHIKISKSCLPLQKRLRFASPTPSQEVRESSVVSAARVNVAPGRPMSKELGYRITDTWDELVGASEKIVPTTLQGVNQRAADHRRQGMIKELLAADHKRQVQLTKALSNYFIKSNGYYIFLSLKKMAPKQTRRSTPVITTPAPETTTSVTNAQLQATIDQGVTAALAARDANRNGDDSHTSGMRRPVQVAHECTYPDFLKCQPLNFKGTEGVVGLSQWFEKIESVFSISNCTVACQVKFATCTLQGNALTWWNSHVKTTTPEAAHAMSWRTLKKMMTDKYCPRGEIKKLESEM
nr:hypothetical protein [Tanacetum cinerariifolium]